METVKGWLVVGTILVYFGINGIMTGPIDNRITSILGPYIMTPAGFLVLLRGLFALPSLEGISRIEKWGIGSYYPIVTLGVLFVVFNWIAPAIRERSIQLLASGWPSLALGVGLIAMGFLLRKAAERFGRSKSGSGISSSESQQ